MRFISHTHTTHSQSAYSTSSKDKQEEISAPIDSHKVSWASAIFSRTPEYKHK